MECFWAIRGLKSAGVRSQHQLELTLEVVMMLGEKNIKALTFRKGDKVLNHLLFFPGGQEIKCPADQKHIDFNSNKTQWVGPRLLNIGVDLEAEEILTDFII